MKIENTTYDTLVVGAGLTGLFLTHRLKQAGQNVLLIDARETLGGQFRRLSASSPYSNPSVDFFPATSEALNVMEWAQSISPTPLRFEVVEHRPQIFDEGRLRAFAGFGDMEFQSIDALSHFSHAHEILIEPGLDQVVRALAEQLPISAATMTEVNGFNVQDGRIVETIINGDKTIKASNVIFTPFVGLLNDLIPGEGLQAKNRTRLAKMQTWTAVVLELKHETPLLEDSALRVFNHGAKEFEPVLGRVFGQVSKWMTLVHQEREAEHEFSGQNIRHIKRQLKRAWPEILDGSVQEKIYILPKALGQHALKTKEPLKFPEISNLYLGSHSLATIPGGLSRLEVARRIEELLIGNLNELPELGASC